MIALAVVLLLIVAVFSVAVVISNPAIIDLSIFGAHLPVTAAGVYFNGAGAMLVLVIALDLLRRGVRRQVRRRRREKSLRAVASGATRAPVDDPADGARRSPAADPADAERAAAPDAADADTARRGRGEKSGNVSADAESGETAAPSADSTTPRPAQQDGESAPTGATALGSASVLERQALLEEAEELTGDDSRR